VYRLIDGRATLTPVTAGSADTNFRAISAGLAAGEQVIVFPGDAIHDGLRVKPRGK
jgi:HlyD family secretion protein